MKSTDTHAFINQLLVCLLVTIGVGGSIGLGTVWMRHQISVTAETNRVLAQRVAEVERHIAETKTLLESEQSPELLRQRNTEWRLGLVPVSETPFVHVTDDPVQRMVARSNRNLFGESQALLKLPFALRN